MEDTTAAEDTGTEGSAAEPKLPRARPVQSQRWIHGVGAVTLCAAVVVLCAFVQRLPCTQSTRTAGGALALNWSNGRPFTDYCYSDVIALYGADHIDQPGEFPYRTSWIENPGTPSQQVHYVEYPVLVGLFMWTNAELTGAYEHLAGDGVLPTRLNVTVYFYLSAIWLALAWLLVVRSVAGLSGGDLLPALLVALSPLVIVQLLTNYDALAVAFATGGMLAWARHRPLLAGVLFGLGGATKLYPLLLLIPCLTLCLRAGRLRSGVRVLAGAAVAWLVVDLPIAVLYPNGWSFFFRFSAERGAGFESLFNIGAYFTGWSWLDPSVAPGATPVFLNTAGAAIFAGCCVLICGLTLAAPLRPRFAQLSLLVVVAFLLSSKVYSPQYSLWLVPLAALALPRWRLLVPWMVLDACVWIPTMLFQRQAVSEGAFLATVLARDLAIVAICAIVVRDILRPAADPVRSAGLDDPMGGVLDGAPDRVRLGRTVRA